LAHEKLVADQVTLEVFW